MCVRDVSVYRKFLFSDRYTIQRVQYTRIRYGPYNALPQSPPRPRYATHIALAHTHIACLRRDGLAHPRCDLTRLLERDLLDDLAVLQPPRRLPVGAPLCGLAHICVGLVAANFHIAAGVAERADKEQQEGRDGEGAGRVHKLP